MTRTPRTAIVLVALGYLVPLAVLGANIALLNGLDSGAVGVVGSSLYASFLVAAAVGVALLVLALELARRGLRDGDARFRWIAWATLPGLGVAAVLLYNVVRYL